MTQGIVLAAGQGTRLGLYYPKCLVRVNGREILDYQIESYHNAGVTDITVVTGFRHELIEKYVQRYDGVSTIYNSKYKTTNNMYSLQKALSWTNGDVVWSNADVVPDNQFVSKLLSSNGGFRVMFEQKNIDKDSVKIKLHKGRVSSMAKSHYKYDGCSADFYFITATAKRRLEPFIDQLVEKDKNLWFELAIDEYLRYGGVLTPCPTNGMPWVEVDNKSDLARANEVFK